MSKEIRSLLKERFDQHFPKKRLLAVQLNGFSHTVFMDNGSSEDEVQAESVSFFMPEKTPAKGVKELFEGFGHSVYQHNAKEYVWILPEER